MFSHAVDSKKQVGYTATVFIKRESSQIQPGQTSLFSISINEWEYFILNGHEELKYSLKVSILYCEYQDSNYS